MSVLSVCEAMCVDSVCVYVRVCTKKRVCESLYACVSVKVRVCENACEFNFRSKAVVIQYEWHFSHS